MSAMNSYLAIAEKDLEAANGLKEMALYNQSAKLYQQFIEKSFKHIIDCNTGTILESDINLLKTHNLVRLAQRVENITGISFGKEDMFWLRIVKDYYFEVGYPGDDFIEITKEQIDDLSFWVTGFAKVIQTHIQKQAGFDPVNAPPAKQ